MSTQADGSETHGWLGEEFLTWLWFRWETDGGEFTLPGGRPQTSRRRSRGATARGRPSGRVRLPCIARGARSSCRTVPSPARGAVRRWSRFLRRSR